MGILCSIFIEGFD